MTLLIGLIGLKQSGKDTFADYLVHHHHFHKFAFAEPVKKICQIMFQLTEAQLHESYLKEQVDQRWGLSPRQMMQKVGTDLVRQLWDDDFWVKHLDMRLGDLDHGHVIVSDVRFPNEAQWIQNKGGVLIRICDGRESLDSHSSETSQTSIQENFVIFNEKNGLESFHEKIEEWIQKLFEQN